ncbi:GtrA family protein [Pseudooceanicola marinus]|uniref:GtrA family protein n=1 Tax=Pseudooceanicola marinus TaxID=396013 RepID=UPI001CD21B2A|nr:GtrA family protein [Pseudooceanicola marinus]MCA1338167.1 GtrA family protein [Pseudooceanicola marinus]
MICLYAAFAVVSTAVNLLVQRLVLLYSAEPYIFVLALLAGTAAGLMTKYVLDKKWIFFDTESGIAAHGRKFGLYTAMGLVTTAVFWGMETAFWVIWQTQMMREVGAILGLSIGYCLKYFLDRKYVFTASRQGVS